MPLPTGLRRDSGGIFQLRIGVPDDIRPFWPRLANGKMAVDAYRRSLKTRDRTDAVTQAHALIADYQRQFAALRERTRPRLTELTPKLVTYLQGQIKHELLEGDDVRRIVGRVLDGVPIDLAAELPDELTDAERLRCWAEALKLSQPQGEYVMTERFVDMLLRNIGLPPANWSQQAAALALLGRTLAQTYTALAERATGALIDTPPPPEPFVPEVVIAQPQASNDPAKTLRDAVPHWKRLTNAKDNAIQRMDRALELWEAAVGVVPIDQITRATGGKFVLYLLDPERPFKRKTASNHASNIGALMNVAAKQGLVHNNPLDLSFSIDDSENRSPWTMDELQRLHSTSVAGEQPEGVDAADADLLISMLLWSGARIGEIARIRVEDVQVRDGILAAYIRRETTKEDVSVRWLPIAAAIQPMVVKHRDRRRNEGNANLLPTFNRPIKVTPSDQAGRWFLEYRRRLGLPTGALDGSHKWRHTVRTKLAAEGLGEALLDAVTGHQAAGGSAGRKSYTHADQFPLAKVLEAVERLAWPWPARSTS